MKKKNHLCIPPQKLPTASPRTRRFTQSTLLDRFREAMLRLIMLSALINNPTTSPRRSDCQPQPPTSSSQNNNCYYARMSIHQSEAVADCIEFIKKKKACEDNNLTVTTTNSIIEDAAELEICKPTTVPVM